MIAAADWISVSCDSVEVFETPEGRTSHLFGSVVIAIDEVEITGSEAFVYEADQRAVVMDVTARDGEMTVIGERLIYYRNEDKVIVTGESHLTSADEIISADTLVYVRSERRIEGRGSLRVVSLKDETVVTGGEGEYYLEDHSGVLFDSPILTVKGGDATTVKSQRMRIDERNRVATAAGSVGVSMNSGEATCDSLEYDLDNEVASMWGNPRIEGENGWMTGDSIDVFFTERQVARTLVVGRASGEYQLSDGGLNKIQGDTVEIFFESGEMASIVVRGSAEGTYIEGTED